MRFEINAVIGLCASAAIATAIPGPHDGRSGSADEKRMHEITAKYKHTTLGSLPKGQCSKNNIAVRKEWDSLTEDERLEYLQAAKCLQSKPSKGSNPHAATRFDDFVLGHIDQTLFVHFSALIFPWHRWFIWLYEQALREECGYTGYQPYWDWSKYVADPDVSTIFDGSDASFGTNGEYVFHNGTTNFIPNGPPPAQTLTIPSGTGGGCISGGPFADRKLVLDAGNEGATTPIKIFDRPRCLTRDFNITILANQNSYRHVVDTITKSSNAQEFWDAADSFAGVHGGGHAFIGGENLNLFTSPSDPVFYLHHAMLDRVWAIWQSRDMKHRKNALHGTLTATNYPPTHNATIDDLMHLGDLENPTKIGQIMSTVEGLSCYVYQ